MFDLAGRVALVTGAGRGIGQGIAAALAARGAAVAVNDVVAERADAVAASLRASGASVFAAVADVTDPAAVRAMVAAVGGRLGPVDILVNNAGIPAEGIRPRRFIETAPADWDPLIRLNVHGVLNSTHAALPSMIEKGWGRVVTITSDSGRTGDPNLAVYAASKAAAAGFMRSIAREVGANGVTCNCLSLGTVLPADAEIDGDRLARQVRRYPMGRLGTPADVAAAAVWLASDEAGWVTGQTIPINGGYQTS
jgi:3-oxoacyl-[acyl-carrier protein] reductase